MGKRITRAILTVVTDTRAVRAGGDLRNLGGETEGIIRFCCPDGGGNLSVGGKKKRIIRLIGILQ